MPYAICINLLRSCRKNIVDATGGRYRDIKASHGRISDLLNEIADEITNLTLRKCAYEVNHGGSDRKEKPVRIWN